MKLTIISHPQEQQDYEKLSEQTYEKIHSFHIRKPQWQRQELENYLRRMPLVLRRKSVTHQYFGLSTTYQLWGIHLNRRCFGILKENAHAFETHRVISASLNTLSDMAHPMIQRLAYFFLSPIFDSLSKENHPARWTHTTLKEALNQPQIPKGKAFALGGITLPHLPICQALGFAGVAVLGSVWGASAPTAHVLRLSTALSR